MSIQSAFSNGKTALRRGGIAFAAIATMFAANAADAAGLSPKECGVVFGTSSRVVGVVGAEIPLSAILPQTLANFIAPSNPEPVRKIIIAGNFREIAASKSEADMTLKQAIIPTLTCDGPKEIVTPTDADVAAFNTIRGDLLPDINLWDYQVRSVAGPVAAANLD